jgi:hypothetical protein
VRADGSEGSRRRRRWNCATALKLRDDDGTARQRWNCATVFKLRRRERKFLKLGSRDQFFSFCFSPTNFVAFSTQKIPFFGIFFFS